MDDWREVVRETQAYIIDATRYGIDGPALMMRLDVLVGGEQKHFHIHAVIQNPDGAAENRDELAEKLKSYVASRGFDVCNAVDGLRLADDGYARSSFPWKPNVTA